MASVIVREVRIGGMYPTGPFYEVVQVSPADSNSLPTIAHLREFSSPAVANKFATAYAGRECRDAEVILWEEVTG